MFSCKQENFQLIRKFTHNYAIFRLAVMVRVMDASRKRQKHERRSRNRQTPAVRSFLPHIGFLL